MSNAKTIGKKSFKERLAGLLRQQLFIPVAALLALIIFNLIADPGFFQITLGQNNAGDPVLSGYLITILNNASELVILAIGMTLVTSASGGQDISVGATIAIAGSVMLRVLCGDAGPRPETMQAPILVAFLVACVVAMLFGAFNGVLVAYFKIQPMVATLIMFTSGRSIAAWINNNELPIIKDPSFAYFGNFIPGIPIPTPVFIAVACMIVIALVLKFTNLGLYTQSVGINSASSRLNGINPAFTKFLSYVICGLLAGIGGYVYFMHVGSGAASHASGAEMNAIASSIIGGTMLTGGVGNIIGTLFGVLSLSLIQNIVSSVGLDQAWWTGITIAAMLCVFLVVQSIVISRKKNDKSADGDTAVAEVKEAVTAGASDNNSEGDINGNQRSDQ